MSTTIRDKIEKELARHESKAAQLRGKLALLERQCPRLLDTEVPKLHLAVYGNRVAITIFDRQVSMPELPTKLLAMSDEDISRKSMFDSVSDGGKLENLDFNVADGIDLSLIRKQRMSAKCRTAIVKQEVTFCGDIPSDMEVLEWVEE